MKFLVVGDIVGNSGMKMLKDNLEKIKKEEAIDFCIVNGENATGGRGIKEKELKQIYKLGADVVTMGNHLYYRKESAVLYKTEPNLIIPANITNLEGRGFVFKEKNNKKICVINLLGKVYLNELSGEYFTDPFKTITKVLEKVKKEEPDYIFLDFHAEASAEKIAMGHYLKNDVTCVYGTHTHVQTADERIMGNGMAYITDVGMTGPKESVIGLKTEIALHRFLTGEKTKYECSESEGILNAIVVTTDDNTNKAIDIKRIYI